MKTKLNLTDFKENELTVAHKKAIMGGNFGFSFGAASEEESETNTDGVITRAPAGPYNTGSGLA